MANGRLTALWSLVVVQEQALDTAAEGSDTVTSFLAQRGLATISSSEPDPAVVCENQPFHWNGSELVICSIGPASWSGIEAVPVDVSLVADDVSFHFSGSCSADRVLGVAPEYRAQLVAHYGPEFGNAQADAAGVHADTHRLFVTPNW